MERLKVAALEFVELAETGTELGIVSYSDDADASSGRANEPIFALGADRSDWTDAIRGLTPDNWTNIGAGLRKARDMITSAGGVTANTYIVLMTDGLNNRPQPQATADADLQAAVDDLLADGIPVYVTCTGSDRGLEAQCSEIAAGTSGHYVDSEDASALPDAFVKFHARGAGYEQILSATGLLSKAAPTNVFVEQGSEAVSFVLSWDKKNASAGMTVTHKDTDTDYDSLPMTQGRYLRVENPPPGEWVVNISVGGVVFVDSEYVLSAFSWDCRLVSIGGPLSPARRSRFLLYRAAWKASSAIQRKALWLVSSALTGRKTVLNCTIGAGTEPGAATMFRRTEPSPGSTRTRNLRARTPA